MDETTKAIINRITVRHKDAKRIPSGHLCTVFYDCIQLTPAELARLAAEATGDLPENAFDIAVGIAYNGILFAAAIAGGKQVGIVREDKSLTGPAVKGKRVVLVDDVIHSGGRMLESESALRAAGATVIGFACIIDRSEGKFSPGRPVWSAYQTDMA